MQTGDDRDDLPVHGDRRSSGAARRADAPVLEAAARLVEELVGRADRVAGRAVDDPGLIEAVASRGGHHRTHVEVERELHDDHQEQHHDRGADHELDRARPALARAHRAVTQTGAAVSHRDVCIVVLRGGGRRP